MGEGCESCKGIDSDAVEVSVVPRNFQPRLKSRVSTVGSTKYCSFCMNAHSIYYDTKLWLCLLFTFVSNYPMLTRMVTKAKRGRCK